MSDRAVEWLRGLYHLPQKGVDIREDYRMQASIIARLEAADALADVFEGNGEMQARAAYDAARAAHQVKP